MMLLVVVVMCAATASKCAACHQRQLAAFLPACLPAFVCLLFYAGKHLDISSLETSVVCLVDSNLSLCFFCIVSAAVPMHMPLNGPHNCFMLSSWLILHGRLPQLSCIPVLL